MILAARAAGRRGAGGQPRCVLDKASSSSRRGDLGELETRFQSLVQSPLRAGLLRFLNARPEESFDIEGLMQTFGRMRLDI